MKKVFLVSGELNNYQDITIIVVADNANEAKDIVISNYPYDLEYINIQEIDTTESKYITSFIE